MRKNFHNMDDNELVALCKSGDEDAYSALIARYLFSVRARAFAYQNSGIDSEDLVQEGFIGLLEAVKCYENSFGTSFSTFAYLCIDRKIISAVRKSLSKKQIPNSALVFIKDDDRFLDKNENPESLIISKEGVASLQRRITEKLSKTEKNVLDLYLMGYSYSKISAALSISEKAVDNAIQRIRRKLK